MENFALLQWPKATGTSGEAARKTCGTERFHSPFSLNFDQFYQMTFNRLARQDITHLRDMTDLIWFEFMASAGLKTTLYSRETGS